MAGHLSLEGTVASSSESHSSDATLITDDRPHAGVLAGIIPALLRSGYNSIDVESRSASDQKVINKGQQPETTPGPHPRSYDTSSGSEIIHNAIPNAGQHAAMVTIEDGSEEAPLDRPGRSWTWVAVLIFIVLLTIMLLGLIVGVVTKQVAWGIATSGAVAPVVVFFGGLFYHRSK
ncbi:hypothetical protein KVR01_000521 [Diaporthe batatas]|uniref:uncharacterized protein n=1 Tax=Diaporthe batatas TaxID=748121 RepID=UPI001D058314|nr:uncharacterized protein KVR01_000521 [Diaporthe batatas]KAG8169776.1 hypothetical protein KVR01_000521 [Diaporthe batatas]